MPNWKKVVVSGSDALISHLTASGGIKGDTITGTIAGTGVVDTTQLAADAVTGAKIADNAINSEHILMDLLTQPILLIVKLQLVKWLQIQ